MLFFFLKITFLFLNIDLFNLEQMQFGVLKLSFLIKNVIKAKDKLRNSSFSICLFFDFNALINIDC
jgi:hypothetical protein